MADLLARVGDTTVPLRACHWVLLDGNGCAHGSLLGDAHSRADDAHREFTPRQRDRDRQTRQGWRVELLTGEQWDQRARRCLLGRCDHAGLLADQRHDMDPLDAAFAALAPRGGDR